MKKPYGNSRSISCISVSCICSINPYLNILQSPGMMGIKDHGLHGKQTKQAGHLDGLQGEAHERCPAMVKELYSIPTGKLTSDCGAPKLGMPFSSKVTGEIQMERPSQPVPISRLPWKIIQTLPSMAVVKEA